MSKKQPKKTKKTKKTKKLKKTLTPSPRRTTIEAERAESAIAIASVIVHLKVDQHRPLRVLYGALDQVFSIFVEDLCKAIGVDAKLEIARMREATVPFSEIGTRRPDGSMKFEHVIRLVDLDAWFSEVSTPPTVAGNQLLRQLRRDLYQGIWAALGRVTTPAGPLEWSSLTIDDDETGEPLVSDEQIAADFGVPPVVVNQVAWTTRAFGDERFGKWS